MKRFERIGLVLLLVLGTGSFLCAEDPLFLLEEAIYMEETLGNLDDAIELYQQIVDAADASRPTSALATYRLGMCYHKSGRVERAQATFEKLSKLYPEQQDLIALIPPPFSGQLELGPVPWGDGEILRFAIKYKSGRQVGTITYRFESTTESGTTAWNIQSAMDGGTAYTSVLVDAETNLPISSIIKDMRGRKYQTRYGSRQIEFFLSMDGTSVKKVFPLIRTTYDDLQLIPILRCLPLSEGFHIAFPIFSSDSNDVLVDASIEVIAKERIMVPAGTFDCYQVTLARGNRSPSSTYWISDDDNSYVVKVSETRQVSGTVPELVDLELSAIGIGKHQ